MKLNKFHSLCINHAHRMHEMNMSIPAVVFALKPNGDVLYLCRQWIDYEDKQFMYKLYAAIMQFEKIRMYCFISEMWFVKTKTETDILPSEHPDRQTCVMVVSADKNRELHNMFIVSKGQLIDENENHDNYKNYIDLFNRLPEIPEIHLKQMFDAPIPPWYKTIKHESFINVTVDA